MCGIVGYVGERSCRELLMHGLERLEYRGYDSAGLSLLGDGRIESVRAVGNLSRLREAVDASESNGGAAVATKIAEATTGIGHTRWATHGKPSERNAHPHPDCTGPRAHRPQRHHRELRRAARGSSRPRATTSPPRPTPRPSRT